MIPGSLYIRCEYSSTQLRNIYNHKSKVIKFCTRYMMVVQRWGHSIYSGSKRDMAIPEPYWNPTDSWECLFSLVLRTNYWLVFNSASWSKFPQFTLLYDSWLHLLGAPSSEIILCSYIWSELQRICPLESEQLCQTASWSLGPQVIWSLKQSRLLLFRLVALFDSTTVSKTFEIK